MENKENIVKVTTPEGELDIQAYLAIKRDDRNVHLFKISDGSLGFITESYLTINDGKKVENTMRFTEKTFAQLLMAMIFAADYFGIDLEKYSKQIADGDEIKFEFAGNGEFHLKNNSAGRFKRLKNLFGFQS